MPVKRKYSELTGGSGDVNPQTLILKYKQSNNDIQGQDVSPLPIPRLPIQQNKSMVMEFLSVEFSRSILTPALNGITQYMAFLTTNPNGPVGVTYEASAETILTDPRVIATWDQQILNGSANTTVLIENQKYIDLTDQAGHGFLVATDNIYFGIITAGTTASNIVYARISYRFKEVTLQEYIGIVQSQQ